MTLADEVAKLAVTKNSDRGVIRRAVEALRARDKARAWLEHRRGAFPGDASKYWQGVTATAVYAITLLGERPIAAKED